MRLRTTLLQSLWTAFRASPRSPAASAWAGFACLAPDDAGAAVRLPRRGDPRAAARDCRVGRADPDPGLLQRWTGILVQSVLRSCLVRSGSRSADRGKQLLRAGSGRRHQSFRTSIGSSAGDSCWSAGRGAGDAVRRDHREAHAHMVRTSGFGR